MTDRLPEALLRTKLFAPPAQPHRVHRSRLLERLTKGLQRAPGITLVSAPAGFGKTTLVSEWITNCEWPAAWLSLDEEDSDLSRFLTYVVTAVQTVAAPIGQPWLAHLQAPQLLQAEPLLTTLVNDIATNPGPIILVLDDYHRIESKPVDEALAFLVEHQPPQMHLVIVGREDPPLPLARLRARGQLTELRAADLRFTPAEAAEFLNLEMGLNLSPDDITALETRTEGWIAGLQLAMLAIQGRNDVTGFIQAFTGSHRFVLDYLVEEVLRRQPEPVRTFLLQTAILDGFCSSLCNAVTGRDDGKAMLASLEHSNLFVIPLDDQRRWFRYHHLFADVLQVHLQETQPDLVATLHGRASAWYEQNSLRPAAIQHALAAEDLEGAAALIELAWPAAEAGTIPPTNWLGWIRQLPEALIQARPVLNVCYAFALLGRGDLEAAETRLQDAEYRFVSKDPLVASPESHQRRAPVAADKEQLGSLEATIAVGRAYIAQARGNRPDTVRYASQVLEFAKADPVRRGQASMLLGMSYWANGDLEAAAEVFSTYTLKLRQEANIPDAIGTSVVLADIQFALGHLRDAIQTLDQLLHYVLDLGGPIPPETADLYRALSQLHLERGHLEAAAHHLQKSADLSDKAQLPFSQYRICIDRARLATAQGDLDGALAQLDEAQRLYVRSPLPDVRPISALKARIWVMQGELTRALGWARERGLSFDDTPGYLREFEHTTLARVVIARHRADREPSSLHEIIGLLERLLLAAEAGHRNGSVIEILALSALAQAAQAGGGPRALRALQRALALAEPEGFVRVFLDEGEPMAELLGRLRDEGGRQKTYIRDLLAAFGARNAHPSALTLPPLVEPLSDSELEVLLLLKTELSGPEIARKRMVSLSTIRTHTQHVFAKLGVNNRWAAVRRAEELGLL